MVIDISILDKLIEKKDLKLYVLFRKERLLEQRKYIIEKPERKRGIAYKKLEGRIEELDHLLKNIHKLKEHAKNDLKK